MKYRQIEDLKELIKDEIAKYGEDDPMVKQLQRQVEEMEAAPEPDEVDTQTYFTRVVMKTKKAKRSKTSPSS